MEAARPYRSLAPDKVIETIGLLHHRIAERFPGAGLADVCAELLRIAGENSNRAESITRRNMPLRMAIVALLALGLAGLAYIVSLIDFSRASADSVFSVVQGLEAAANLVVLLGAALFFLVSIEVRLKRRRALAALHELRSIIHVIDMHQLTKDPAALSGDFKPTVHSPVRITNRQDLARYLDYCSEMLSITGKLAALFAQSVNDDVVVGAVNDIEELGSNLSRKIWQKITMIEGSAATRPK
jgi:hypothetical protein